MGPDGYPRADLLADPDWLEEHRDDPHVRIVDCAPQAAYKRAHVPGAVGLPVHPWIKGGGLNDDGVGRSLASTMEVPAWTTGEGDAWIHVMPADEFAELMDDLGISQDTTVVAYDDFHGGYAARLWWALDYYGHEDAKVLDGAWQGWVDEGRPVATGDESPPPGTFDANPEEDRISRLKDLMEGVAEERLSVLDVRTDGEWRGENTMGNERGGHIPGATHIEWFDFMDEERRAIRPAEEIQALLEEEALSPEDEVVTHCQAGIRAAYSAFVLTLMGFDNVRVYDASMLEWANRDDTPLVTEPP